MKNDVVTERQQERREGGNFIFSNTVKSSRSRMEVSKEDDEDEL